MGTKHTYARETIIWRNLINAIALELGLAPVLSTDAREALKTGDLLAEIPVEEKRVITRRFRKLHHKLTKHMKKVAAQRMMRRNRNLSRQIIIDFIEDVCIELFPQVAAQFDDTRERCKENYRNATIFKQHSLDVLTREFKDAALKLAGGKRNDERD